MADIDAVLVDNFKEALRQANRYLVLGLFSSLFFLALNLDPAAFIGFGKVSLPGGLPPLPIRYAQIALAMVYWVAPFLTYFSLARAERIGAKLQQRNDELLKAAATYPSIATTRVHGPRWITSLVPPLLVGIAGWVSGAFSFSACGMLFFLIAVVPYIALFGQRLRRSFGNLGPDLYGD
jgi:hypothetical protein